MAIKDALKMTDLDVMGNMGLESELVIKTGFKEDGIVAELVVNFYGEETPFYLSKENASRLYTMLGMLLQTKSAVNN